MRKLRPREAQGHLLVDGKTESKIQASLLSGLSWALGMAEYLRFPIFFYLPLFV